MEIQKHLKEQRELYYFLYSFLLNDDENTDHQNFQNLITFQKTLQSYAHGQKLKSFLYLLNNMTEHHYRNSTFFNKIEKILLFYKNDIKQTLSNFELFQIFENNKSILLLLFINDLIMIDESVINSMNKHRDYCHFFCLDKPNNDSIFEDKRRTGENDSYICSLIRSDSLSGFIQYVNQNNLSNANSFIKESLFETHSFLNSRRVTVIEYAAFFGSLKIIQYLKYKNVPLYPDLWIYAIHSNKADLIHFLEQNKVQLPNDSPEKCIEEAIKCHHNEIARYLLNNFSDIYTENKNDYLHNILHYSLRYDNYEFTSEEYQNEFILAYSCKYNYINLLNLLMKNGGIDINKKITDILKIF